jgi:ATP phosphoribosyltransferase
MEELRIATQKSGRLSEDSLSLFKECGIAPANAKGKLRSKADDFPAELLFLRDDDIPRYIEDRVADIGVVGANVVYEKGGDLSIEEQLGFSKCRLSLAVPKNEVYDGVEDFQGKRIATSYPGLVNDFLKRNAIDAEVHEISGSVEIAPGIGLADAVCDIVSSGSTLFTNGLKEVETVLHSEAVLVANKELSPEKRDLLDKVLFRIRSVKNGKKHKYILLNAPDDRIETISEILPSMKSPTVLPLVEEGWSSLHSVVDEDQFWHRIDRLKEEGAQGILVVPIEKMVV